MLINFKKNLILALNKINKIKPIALMLDKEKVNLPKNFMWHFYLVILAYVVLGILFSIIKIGNNKPYTPYFLLSVPLPAIYLLAFYISNKEKKQRDLIKLVNDSLLYFIAAIVAFFAVIKTVPHSQHDPFSYFLESGTAYIALSFYAFFLFIKAFITMKESIENIKSYKEQSKKDSIEDDYII
ncbi:hypothetical protein ORN12_18240 [Pantoea vagans]|uniref:hypothetical protein n=1 Tax=Pantoea vagans TaxID=470934 RepID=UPI00225BA8DE|nr:hypothetical protein [Pantoea vagans]MCX3310921.1 hypothetical protein [Pantoea vagans]